MKIFIDGKFYAKEDAKVSVFDHGLLYGDGVFEGIRIYNGKIFKAKEHIVRLYESAKAIFLKIEYTQDEMEKLLNEAVKVNEKKDGYIRLIVTRGDGPLGIDPFQCAKSKLIIIVGDITLYPKEFYEKGIEIITSSYRRMPSESLDPRIKSLNYLNNILAKIEAKQNNYFESVMLNTKGFVAECTGDNIFTVKNNVIITPPSYDGALEGITRNTVLQLANKIGFETREMSLTRYDLYNSNECFLTGTGAEIIPVVKIDNNIIGDGVCGNVTKKVILEFRRFVSE
ncbi:MAG TPA: branched-chain-amino-acid transaminase [Spirochaetota bacterium]|nr:branched-chain-amino-acid transaminase [Spirochaetota bacterium]